LSCFITCTRLEAGLCNKGASVCLCLCLRLTITFETSEGYKVGLHHVEYFGTSSESSGQIRVPKVGDQGHFNKKVKKLCSEKKFIMQFLEIICANVKLSIQIRLCGV